MRVTFFYVSSRFRYVSLRFVTFRYVFVAFRYVFVTLCYMLHYNTVQYSTKIQYNILFLRFLCIFLIFQLLATDLGRYIRKSALNNPPPPMCLVGMLAFRQRTKKCSKMDPTKNKENPLNNNELRIWEVFLCSFWFSCFFSWMPIITTQR